MFEQSLYNQEAFKEVKSQEGELFHDYEIKNWDITPRLYKILAISAIANIAVILIAGQTSLLTAKGCDSPLVSRVCQVLDTVYVGSVLFGTDREYVDQAYEKTELADADITYVDVSSISPPLYYPSDYLKYSDPDAYARQQQQENNPDRGFIAPGIPNTNPTTSGDMLSKTPHYPKYNPKSGVGPDLTSPLGTDTDDASIAAMKKGHTGRIPGTNANSNSATGSLGGNTNTSGSTGNATNPIANTNSADPTNGSADASVDDAKEDKNGIIISKPALRRFADENKSNIEKIRTEAQFKVVIAADLGYGKDKDGKPTRVIILRNPKALETVLRSNADSDMAKLAKDGIIAVGDSGWFGYLTKFDVKKVIITVVQDENDFKVTVRADQKDENAAKMVASGLGGFISLGKMTSQGDEKTFLEKAGTTYEGNTFLLNFAMPKQDVIEMIKRKLMESGKKENSTAQTANLTTTSAK